MNFFDECLSKIGIISILILTGCASMPETVIDHRVSRGGVPYTLILSPEEHPCGNAPACVNLEFNIVWIIIDSKENRQHEEDHVDGMLHTDWDSFTRCSTVTRGG